MRRAQWVGECYSNAVAQRRRSDCSDLRRRYDALTYGASWKQTGGEGEES